MPTLRPTAGVNLRLSEFDIGLDQFAFMQNMDMGQDLIVRQIKGSAKYHNASLGTNAPTAVLPYYNNDTGEAQVLVAVDGKILKRSEGKNEFETLKTGLRPSLIRTAVLVKNFLYIQHPDGILEYDGVSKVRKLKKKKEEQETKVKDLVFSKETNRAFAVLDDAPNQVIFTDDVVTTQGVPTKWSGFNVDVLPPTQGDIIEKLWILRGRLVYLMTNSVWIQYINGGPENWRIEKAPTTVGCIAPWTVKQVGQELWFLGYSPNTGRGIYAFNGQTSRLLSYDIQRYIDRINDNRITQAVAEYVDDQYRISFAIDGSIENNITFHADVLQQNPQTQSPNFYGPHTYGFSASGILNTRKFRGEHLIARKHSDGARVFRIADYETFYSDELVDNGDLIPTVLKYPVISSEQTERGALDESWVKRYRQFITNMPPVGTWSARIELRKDFQNEAERDFEIYMEGNNSSVEDIILGKTPPIVTGKQEAYS